MAAINGLCGMRVKYLSKQDIEYFGFVFLNSSEARLKEYKVSLGRGTANTIIKTDYITLFCFNCRNKNEFHRLLRQFSII